MDFKIESDKLRKSNDFLLRLLDIGHRDFSVAMETLEDLGENIEYFLEAINEYLLSYGYSCNEIKRLDINSVLFWKILEDASDDFTNIIELIIKAGSNYLNYSLRDVIEIDSNYMCTSYDCNESDREDLQNIVEKYIRPDQISKKIKFVLDQIDIKIQ